MFRHQHNYRCHKADPSTSHDTHSIGSGHRHRGRGRTCLEKGAHGVLFLAGYPRGAVQEPPLVHAQRLAVARFMRRQPLAAQEAPERRNAVQVACQVLTGRGREAAVKWRTCNQCSAEGTLGTVTKDACSKTAQSGSASLKKNTSTPQNSFCYQYSCFGSDFQRNHIP